MRGDESRIGPHSKTKQANDRGIEQDKEPANHREHQPTLGVECAPFLLVQILEVPAVSVPRKAQNLHRGLHTARGRVQLSRPLNDLCHEGTLADENLLLGAVRAAQ